ncbi:MAG: hypothetical protein ACRD3Y_10500 [Bryobacteraceae bacterium]
MKQMINPLQMWSAWVALSAQSARLGWDAQNVMTLRLARLALGGPRARSEAQRMVSEKVAAVAEAQVSAAAAVIRGGAPDPRVAKKVLGVYQRRVRKNRRRLTR